MQLAHRAGAKVIATSVPDASALKDPLTKASKKGIEIITVNSGLGAFDSLATYEVHVGQTEDVAGKGAGKQFKKAGAKKVLIVIHEASNSGLQQRASGVKSVLGAANVKVLTIPNAKSDIPGTKAKVKAAFNADKKTAGVVSWSPDIYNLAKVKGNRMLVNTGTANKLIADIWFARADFAKDNPEIMEGLARGIRGKILARWVTSPIA